MCPRQLRPADGDAPDADRRRGQPDHHGLESWGYQRVATGTEQSVLSGAQPVVSPNYDTRATADVILPHSGKAEKGIPHQVYQGCQPVR